MGGSASRPPVSNPKDDTDFYIDHLTRFNFSPKKLIEYPQNEEKKVISNPLSRNRRFTKKARHVRVKPAKPTTTLVPYSTACKDEERDLPRKTREHCNTETVMREGVTNIANGFKDWSIILAPSSKTTLTAVETEPKRMLSSIAAFKKHTAACNLFNFHHETYLAQTRQDNRHSSVEVALPRHLTNKTKQPICDTIPSRDCERPHSLLDYNSSFPTKHSVDAKTIVHEIRRNKHHSQDHRDSMYVSHSRQSSPRHKGTDNKHCSPESMIPVKSHIVGRRHSPLRTKKELRTPNQCKKPDLKPDSGSSMHMYSPGDYKTQGKKVSQHQKTDLTNTSTEDSTKKHSIADQLSPRYVNKGPSTEPQLFPRYKKSESKQTTVVQRADVAVKPALSLLMLKVIRVNGVEYVQKKSEHSLMKKLLSDKNPNKGFNASGENYDKEKHTTAKKENMINMPEKETNLELGQKRIQENMKNKEGDSKKNSITNIGKLNKNDTDMTKLITEKVYKKSKESKPESCKNSGYIDPQATQPNIVYSASHVYVPPMKYMPTPMTTMHHGTSHESSATGEKCCEKMSSSKQHNSNKSHHSINSTKNHESRSLAKCSTSTSRKSSKESFINHHMSDDLPGDMSKRLSDDSSSLKHATKSIKSNSAEINHKNVTPRSSHHKVNRVKSINNEHGTSQEETVLPHIVEEISSGNVCTPKEVCDETANKEYLSHPTEENVQKSTAIGLVANHSERALSRDHDTPVEVKPDFESNGLKSPISQYSLKKWGSRSVRSKNKVFENYIRTTSTSPHLKSSRTYCQLPPQQDYQQSPSSTDQQVSIATSKSKISKLGCSTRHAEAQIDGPSVFTPWDSCMMYNDRPARRQSLPLTLLHRTQPRPSGSQSASTADECELQLPPMTHTGPAPPLKTNNKPIPSAATSPKENHVINECKDKELNRTGAKENGRISYEPDECEYNKVEMSHPRHAQNDLQLASERHVYNKLDREVVENFERQFRNSHVYRTVTGDHRPSQQNFSCLKEKKLSTLSDESSYGEGDREKVCNNCGRRWMDVRVKKQCTDCGEISEEHHTCRPSLGNRHKICATCGCRFPKTAENEESSPESSGCVSAKSGNIPPYRKVLKMFEKKSREHTTHSNHQWQPRSTTNLNCDGGGEFMKPASHFVQYKQKNCNEYGRYDRLNTSVSYMKSALTEHRRHSRYDVSEEEEQREASDPHFNKSEQELYRNARSRWETQDKHRRQRAPPCSRSASPRYGAAKSTNKMVKSSCGEASRRHW